MSARPGKGLGVDIEFTEERGGFTGTGKDGREWRITRTVTGWRLEFRDHGDTVATYAGVHASLSAARTEACRQVHGRAARQ